MMALRPDIIAQMRQEEADLARKLKAVRDFLAAYGTAPSNDPRPSTATPAAPEAQREKVGIEGYSPYGRQVVAAAMVKLLTSSEPLRTRQLLEYINEQGIKVSGKEPVNALGALLYRSADIVSHGKMGWTVGDRSTAEEIVSAYAPTKSAPQDDNERVLGAGESQEGAEPILQGLDQPIASAASTS